MHDERPILGAIDSLRKFMEYIDMQNYLFEVQRSISVAVSHQTHLKRNFRRCWVNSPHTEIIIEENTYIYEMRCDRASNCE